MPPTSPTLSDLLAEMFQVSTDTGNGVHRQLSSGLHVKAAQQGQRRMLILWRSENTPPSLTECEVTGTAAGFFHPVFKSWKAKECPVAYLVQEGFKGEICQHTWGMQTHFDAKSESGYTSSCQKCGATWRQATSRRGHKVTLHYNGKKVNEQTLTMRLQAGPVPEGKPAPVQVDPAPAKPAPAPLSAKEQQRQRDAALKKRLVNALTWVAVYAGLTNRWHRQQWVFEARRKYLTDAKLDDLREEVSGRWFAWSRRYAMTFALLVLRYRHMTRALPLVASVAEKPARRTRRKKAEVAAA